MAARKKAPEMRATGAVPEPEDAETVKEWTDFMPELTKAIYQGLLNGFLVEIAEACREQWLSVNKAAIEDEEEDEDEEDDEEETPRKLRSVTRVKGVRDMSLAGLYQHGITPLIPDSGLVPILRSATPERDTFQAFGHVYLRSDFEGRYFPITGSRLLNGCIGRVVAAKVDGFEVVIAFDPAKRAGLAGNKEGHTYHFKYGWNHKLFEGGVKSA